MKIQISFLFFLIYLNSLTSQAQTNDLTLNEVHFESVNGTVKNKATKYILVTSSYSKKIWSAATDSLIANWITKHPKAFVVPIIDIGGWEKSILYCLIVDQKDTINNFLVRTGCIPAHHMMSGTSLSTGPGFHFTPQQYKTYVEQLKEAEKFAKLNKLGIWKNGSE